MRDDKPKERSWDDEGYNSERSLMENSNYIAQEDHKISSVSRHHWSIGKDGVGGIVQNDSEGC